MSIDQHIEEAITACDLPGTTDDPEFEAPWQARAFGLAVVLTEQGHITWNDFQHRFVTRLDDQDGDISEDAYYRHWIEALEETVADNMVSTEELTSRIEAFENGERDASEFVIGVSHDHDHSHDH